MNYKANSEEALAIKISDYLRIQYPDVIFHFDYGSGLKMTKGQAVRQKRLNKHRGYPDLFIVKPMYKKSVSNEAISGGIIWNSSLISSDVFYCGLYIELKKDGTHLKKKDGNWTNEHIADQAKMLEKLRDDGYKAEFAVGFDEAKEIIDNYLKNN